MNTFDVNKRNISTYEQFLKDREKAEEADHDEKGEHPIVKKAMSGEVDGKKGWDTLGEGKLENDKISSRDLSSVLWDNGWKNYFKSEDNLKKKLNKYRSVSDLPQGIDRLQLKNLSDDLDDLSVKIEELIKSIK